MSVGCKHIEPQPGEKEFAPSFPEPVYKGKFSKNGAIYNNQTALALFETPRARRVGDILTILLVERTQAQKRAESKSDKNSQTTIPNPTILGKPVSIGPISNGYNMAFNNQADRRFNAKAESRQDNQLSGSISVTVHKVLNNGNLIVGGEKWVKINTGKEYIRLTGIVRSLDIKPDNTVTSDKVANARIAYSGTGQNHQDQKMGWLSRFLWSSLFPF